MELILKAAGVAAAGAALSLLLKKDSPAMAFAVAIAVAAVIMLMAVGILEPVFSAVGQLAEKTGINSAELSAVLKALGITIITRFAAKVCADAGLGSAESAVQLCGSAGIIWSAMPLILSVLDIIGGLI